MTAGPRIGAPGAPSRGAGETRRSIRLALALALAVGPFAASCEREASKSDYVSARVAEACGPLETTEERQSCRIAVIKEFQDVPLEELRRRYPEPEPRPRPSCSLS